jgi:hypothetical protein
MVQRVAGLGNSGYLQPVACVSSSACQTLQLGLAGCNEVRCRAVVSGAVGHQMVAWWAFSGWLAPRG